MAPNRIEPSLSLSLALKSGAEQLPYLSFYNSTYRTLTVLVRSYGSLSLELEPLTQDELTCSVCSDRLPYTLSPRSYGVSLPLQTWYLPMWGTAVLSTSATVGSDVI